MISNQCYVNMIHILIRVGLIKEVQIDNQLNLLKYRRDKAEKEIILKYSLVVLCHLERINLIIWLKVNIYLQLEDIIYLIEIVIWEEVFMVHILKQGIKNKTRNYIHKMEEDNKDKDKVVLYHQWGDLRHQLECKLLIILFLNMEIRIIMDLLKLKQLLVLQQWNLLIMRKVLLLNIDLFFLIISKLIRY